MGTWNSRDRETVSGTDFGDLMGVVADSSRNPLSTRSMWRATGADGAGFARRYWLSPLTITNWMILDSIYARARVNVNLELSRSGKPCQERISETEWAW